MKNGGKAMKRSDYCNVNCWGRIITTRHTTFQCINEYDCTIIRHMLFCMVHGPKHPEYDLRLYDNTQNDP